MREEWPEIMNWWWEKIKKEKGIEENHRNTDLSFGLKRISERRCICKRWSHRGKAIHCLTSYVVIQTWVLLIVTGEMINIYSGTIGINYDFLSELIMYSHHWEQPGMVWSNTKRCRFCSLWDSSHNFLEGILLLVGNLAVNYVGILRSKYFLILSPSFPSSLSPTLFLSFSLILFFNEKITWITYHWKVSGKINWLLHCVQSYENQRGIKDFENYGGIGDIWETDEIIL